MEKFEYKKCGECIAFNKSSCIWWSSTVKADTVACARFQEKCYTLSATSAEKTITQIDSIMEKEKKLNYALISVYKINNQFVVAKSVEDAIRLYKDAYEYPYNTVKNVKLVSDNAWVEKDETIVANPQDCVSSKSYVVQCDYTAKADEKDQQRPVQ